MSLLPAEAERGSRVETQVSDPAVFNASRGTKRTLQESREASVDAARRM